MTLASSFAALEAQTAAWDEAEAPATVKLNGIEYVCAADIGRITPEFDPSTGETKTIQRATLRLRRSLLATCPTLAARVSFNRLEWFIEELGGQAPDSPVWVLQIKRMITKTAS